MNRSFTFASSGFFAVRLPLFPLDELVRWGEGARAPGALGQGDAALEAAVAADRQRLVAGLRAHLQQPAVREALFVASPSLDEALAGWMDAEAPNVTSIVARYFARLTSRATPFGLFATSAVGEVAPGDGLRLDPDGAALVRHTRLDMEYVSALADALERRPEVRAQLRFAPNSSLHELAGQLRVIEARVDPATGDRRNDLVAIEATASVRAVVRAAAGGATPVVLARALVEARPGVAPEHAAAFVDDLIESRVLVSELAPAVTGGNPLDELIATLGRLPDQAPTTTVLTRARDALAALDRDGVGVAPGRYRAIAADLAALPAPVELRRLFQVDLYRREPGATLGAGVVAELSAAVEALARIGATPAPPGLARFCERFAERYEGRAVPLALALDEDLGVGFPIADGVSSDPAPLLDGLDLPSRPAEDPRFTSADAWKLRRLVSAGAATTWSLDEEDLTALASPPAPLPDAFAVMATLAAPSPEAARQGEYTVLFRGASGPSGARLFGRFCQGDPALRAHVEAHLRAEEARRPDAVFAEIVHLPQGRLGNILCRPALRGHEIAYLARPGAEAIPLTDLLVSVVNGRVVLHSRRLGREVVPRLTSAHAVGPGDLPLYRFLTALQGQGLPRAFAWSWGALASAPRLPRVTLGRVVLAPATWTLRAADLARLLQTRGAARFRAAAELRRQHGLPRWISVGDADQRLALELDNVLAVDTFAELARDRPELELQELYPPPEASGAVSGARGRYVHEVVVPFVRTDPPPAPVALPAGAEGPPRSFAPGSEWLTVKCYCGPAVVDRLLREIVSPLVAEHPGRWFFLRYEDGPGHHLRLRLHGARAALLGELLPALHDRLAPLLEDGAVARVQLDTYQQEVERYGGPEAMPIVEEIFHHDSVAALSIIELLDGDEGADARWRLALRATHDLMVDLGLDLAARLALVTDLRARFGKEHAAGQALERQLGRRYRAERASIAALLAATPAADHPLAPGLEALARRSAALAPLAARLGAGVLTTAPRAEVIASLLHMTANRLLLNQQRTQELVLHDFLARHYTSELARARRPASLS